MKTMERIDEPEINRQIVLTWLNKFELMNEREREIMANILELLSKPILLTQSK
jgi:hypothetical protein